MKYFVPRDVGCNRYPLYDKDGKWDRDVLRDGFKFDGLEDLKSKLHEKYKRPISNVENLEIRDGCVIDGLLIGWVRDLK